MRHQFKSTELKEKLTEYPLIHILKCGFMAKDIVSMKDILCSELPPSEKSEFIHKYGGLTKYEKTIFLTSLAEVVLPVYEDKYPQNTHLRDCLDNTKLFLENKIDASMFERSRALAACIVTEYVKAKSSTIYASVSYAVYTASDALLDIPSYTSYAFGGANGNQKLINDLTLVLQKFTFMYGAINPDPESQAVQH